MSFYNIKNYGFTKTLINDDIYNEIKWDGNYDGQNANINLNIDTNGNTEFVSMKLNNNDLRQLLGIQPIQIPLEKRLMKDYMSNPIALEGALLRRKSRKHNKHKKRKTRHIYY
jgi:hypothetical protein